jgi:hypothetical protein
MMSSMFIPSTVPTPSVTSVPVGTSLTDSLTGWGTIALAIVTFLAVIVTMRTARTDRLRDDERRAQDRAEAERRVQEERHYRRTAQARLILIVAPPETPIIREAMNRHIVRFTLANYSDRPVMGIEAQVWAGVAPLQGACTSSNKPMDDVVRPDRRVQLQVVIESVVPDLELRAWRVCWRDNDGIEWCVDQPGQREPQLFEGQQPHPY